MTGNSSVDERHYLNHAILVTFYTPCARYFSVTFAYLIGESRLFRHIMTL